MNGKTTKYYKFKSSGSGRLTIPISIAKSLNWEDGNEINIIIKEINGQIGLFLFKKEKSEKQ